MFIGDDQFRDRLPSNQEVFESINLLTFLKASQNQNLEKIYFPISLNEPLSVLQKMCEKFEESTVLLNFPNTLEESCKRMCYIVAFFLTNFSRIPTFLKRPFRAVAGETFEFEDPSNYDFKFIAEKVSKKPAISACYAENLNFEYWENLQIETHFWGKFYEIRPTAICHIILKNYKDHFIYSYPKIIIDNLLYGNFDLKIQGNIEILNQTTGDTALIHFQDYENFNAIIKDSDGAKKYTLSGDWTKKVELFDLNGNIDSIIWEKNEQDTNLFYSKHNLQLNHLNYKLCKELPPTDSRFRSDIRAMEFGNLKLAENELKKILQLEKERLKNLEKNKYDSKPLWFDLTNGEYIYNKCYWKFKKENGFTDVMKMF